MPIYKALKTDKSRIVQVTYDDDTKETFEFGEVDGQLLPPKVVAQEVKALVALKLKAKQPKDDPDLAAEL